MSLDNALKFLSLPNACPLCVVALNPENGHPIAINSTFESVIGPLFKFREWEFADAAAADVNPNAASAGGADANRTRFKDAINSIRSSLGNVLSSESGKNVTKMTTKIRNVEMLTLGANDAGLPIRRYFDWNIGSLTGEEKVVILYGDAVKEAESSDRARDAELIDFFQNAPIAMHWLNGNGIVLWANQTELNVLGYTAEEYIGQPIMTFCPDDEKLVLELFKQLGSGNAIADVPVRFRTKDGRLVHLLIDSNVAYNKDGSFGHTRCFIRDDTSRKIRDARSKLLVEETERSLRMLDGFLSRTLHHVMGPLHALRGTCEVVRDLIQTDGSKSDNDERNCDLLERAAITVTTTTRMVADVSDLARFDEGASLRVKLDNVNLRTLGLEAIESIRFDTLRMSGGDDGISVSLELVGAGGPAIIRTDAAVLKRVFAHLLENAVREIDSLGKVNLRITSSFTGTSWGILIEVIDDGPGLPVGTCLDQGNIADDKHKTSAPVHRYAIGSHNFASSNDPDELQKARMQMEDQLRDLRQNGVGVGLPLSYHLVRSIGGDLRHDNTYDKGTRIWFMLPIEEGMANDVEMMTNETIFKRENKPPASIRIEMEADEMCGSSSKRRRSNNMTFATFVDTSDTSTVSSNTESQDLSVVMNEPAPQAVAKRGVKASMPLSVLIVEDTDICARLLAMQLKKMNCISQRAENGRVAIDILTESMPGTFDMVLMDLRMPVMDGLEATKLIRGELGMKDLPVIALTGEMSADIRSECDEIGFDEFYQKPLKKDKLEKIIIKYKSMRDGFEL